MSGYFVAPDAHDVPTLWRENGHLPQPVVNRLDFRDDPSVWGALTAWAAGLLAGEPCTARNDEGQGRLVCYLTGPHDGHAFAGTAGLNLKPEAEDD